MKSTIKTAMQKHRAKVLKALKTCAIVWIASSQLSWSLPRLSAETYCPVTCEEVYSTDIGGCGYQACRRCPVLAPAVALAAVALAGIIAVALQTDHGHVHSHSHHRGKCRTSQRSCCN